MRLALRERVHEEGHGRDVHAVDEAALDQDLGRPLVNELAGHARQVRRNDRGPAELVEVRVGGSPYHDPADPPAEWDPSLLLGAPGPHVATVATAAASATAQA